MADDTDREREIEGWLAELADDRAELSPALRTAILDGLPAPARARRPGWFGRLAWAAPPVTAALCGFWIGVAQPGLVLDTLPGQEAALGAGDPLDEWEGWL